jgi:hypothetical protein
MQKTDWGFVAFVVTIIVTVGGVIGGLIYWLAQQESTADAFARERREAWVEPCRDQSTLLATTAGSPSSFECPNRQHRMRVQVATTPTNEEAAALVVCECVTPKERAEGANDD